MAAAWPETVSQLDSMRLPVHPILEAQRQFRLSSNATIHKHQQTHWPSQRHPSAHLLRKRRTGPCERYRTTRPSSAWRCARRHSAGNQSSSVFFVRRNQDFSRATVAGPTSAAPVHHATCTPANIAPANAAFCAIGSGRNGIANKENHRTPESPIRTTPILAAVRPLSRAGGG